MSKTKVVILAGGLGTRLSEETVVKPKPMVEIGGKPILWHIMKTYSHFGFSDFVICLGYKGYMIKEWFSNYVLHNSDVTINLKKNEVVSYGYKAEDWSVTLVDTGDDTDTGGRLKRIKRHVDGTFMMTYGDGVADINIDSLLGFHRKKGLKATVTAVAPPGRFGALQMDGDIVSSYDEKPKGDRGYINGGYFALEPSVFDYIEGDRTIFERGPLESLASERQLAAFKHEGFWQPMDTVRHRMELDALCLSGKAPWMVWK